MGTNGEGRSGMGRSGFIVISHTLSSQLFELLVCRVSEIM